MIGASEPMLRVFETIDKIAHHKANVLITGESGTGKELVARAIHDRGPRAAARFVAVNCGAIPANLLESELFGHKRGAFTDAVRDKAGLFEEADGGTLFLDEIGELPIGLQVKILRAIQEEEIRRIGDNHTIDVDVRVITATLRDLAQDVRDGRFREDLYYRLNVLPIELPPLRERRQDIGVLIDFFLTRYAEKHGSPVVALSQQARRMLEDYDWPGNIRELENTIEARDGAQRRHGHRGADLRGQAAALRDRSGCRDLGLWRAIDQEDDASHRAVADSPRARSHQRQSHQRRQAVGDQPPGSPI